MKSTTRRLIAATAGAIVLAAPLTACGDKASSTAAPEAKSTHAADKPAVNSGPSKETLFLRWSVAEGRGFTQMGRKMQQISDSANAYDLDGMTVAAYEALAILDRLDATQPPKGYPNLTRAYNRVLDDVRKAMVAETQVKSALDVPGLTHAAQLMNQINPDVKVLTRFVSNPS